MFAIRNAIRFILCDLIMGLDVPTPRPETCVDPLYAEYRARCELARRGWRVDHLNPEVEYPKQPIAQTLPTSHELQPIAQKGASR